jgi:hypothetical protein
VRSLGVNINDGTSAKFRRRSMALSAEHAIKKDPDVTTIRIRMTLVTDAILADVREVVFIWIDKDRADYLDASSPFSEVVRTAFPNRIPKRSLSNWRHGKRLLRN